MTARRRTWLVMWWPVGEALPSGWRIARQRRCHHNRCSIDGTHHHVSGKHLPLYLAEIDYKYNTRKVTDGARTASGIKLVAGKRLTYR